MTRMCSMEVTFWGVRGTIPTPGVDFARYGGNTSCVSVKCGEHWLVFDAGTGIHALGQAHSDISNVDIFLSHTHIDHIMGFPFFRPLYNPTARVRLWAGHLRVGKSAEVSPTIRGVLSTIMSPPIFPLVIDDLKAHLYFYNFRAGESLEAKHLVDRGILITTHLLHHPDHATAYRVEYEGKSVCYVTDVEHSPPEIDDALVDFVEGCDVLIYDSTYSEENYEAHRGWGHSTWEEALRIAEAAKVKQLALFHHDPALNDEALDARAKKLATRTKAAFVAKEGMVLEL
ncbi:MBL fold metallo-hydrolase [bacterium]|nr:MBL fold metallo-hydrolase [bacterium]